MFSVKLIENVPPCCSHSHEAVGEVRAVAMLLCIPGLGPSGHSPAHGAEEGAERLQQELGGFVRSS